jgi:hypothetical protein
MKDEPDSLIDVASNPRVQITIVENVTTRIDIARKNLIVTTTKNHPRSIRQNKI